MQLVRNGGGGNLPDGHDGHGHHILKGHHEQQLDQENQLYRTILLTINSIKSQN